jgi:hypothetical protein
MFDLAGQENRIGERMDKRLEFFLNKSFLTAFRGHQFIAYPAKPKPNRKK